MTQKLLEQAEKYVEHHCIDRKWIDYLQNHGKTFDAHKIQLKLIENLISQLEFDGRTAQTDEHVANIISDMQDGSNLFSLRLGANPRPITDAERAKTLETNRNYFANMLFDFMRQKTFPRTKFLQNLTLTSKFFRDCATISGINRQCKPFGRWFSRWN